VLAIGRPRQAVDYARARGFRHDPAIDTLLRGEDIVSTLTVPILRAEQSIGVFWVASRTSRRFTPREIALLQQLSGQAAISIENARILAREQRDGYSIE